MEKDFDAWNERKKQINENQPIFYHEREIHWCSFGVNIGFEQDGKGNKYRRPALVIKGFSRYACLVVSLTTSQKKNIYYVGIGMINGKENFAIISQIRLIDTRRLHTRLAVLDKEKFDVIRKAIRDLI